MSQRSHVCARLVAVLCLLSCACTRTPAPTPMASVTPDAPIEWTESRTVVAPVELVATGNLSADPELQSSVGTPLAARVSALRVGVGDRVVKGQVLAALSSPEVTKALANHHHAVLRQQLAQRTLEQKRQQFMLGDLTQRPVEEARNEYAASSAELEVAISAHSLARKKLNRALDLFKHGINTRQDVEEARAAEEQARSRVEQARQQRSVASGHRRREEAVARSGALVAPKILEAETELALAQEEVEHAASLLQELGVVPDEKQSSLVLRSPRDGIVVESRATLGQSVRSEDEMFTILDNRRLWLWTYLLEQDISKVQQGTSVTLSVKAFPGKSFRGRISYLSPQLEVASRKLKARVVVDNPQGLLKTGMFADVKIALEGPRPRVVVPSAAVVRQGDRHLVFVQGGDGKPQQQIVEIGRSHPQAGWVEVVSGLKSGVRIAGEGAFFLPQAEPTPEVAR